MTRRPVSPLTAGAKDSATTYQVWLTEEQNRVCSASVTKLDVGWADWVSSAVARLKRETPEELASIIGGIKRTSRQGKIQVSFRVHAHTLAEVKALADEFDSNAQTVLATAFFMHALAPSPALPDQAQFDRELSQSA